MDVAEKVFPLSEANLLIPQCQKHYGFFSVKLTITAISTKEEMLTVLKVRFGGRRNGSEAQGSRFEN